MDEKKIESSAERIWVAYDKYIRTQFIMRKGFGTFSLARSFDEVDMSPQLFLIRGQSVCEHQANVAMLSSMFGRHFPDFFGKDVAKYFLWASITFSLIHDVGEVTVGDVIDDGRIEHDQKEIFEREAFFDFIDKGFFVDEETEFISSDRSIFKNMFDNFQTVREVALYALDKLDPVLMLIFLEKNGLIGNMLDKKRELSKRDCATIKATKSTNPVDNLAAQLKMKLIDAEAPSRVTKPVYAVIRAAVMDARKGSFFSWWDEKLPNLRNI